MTGPLIEELLPGIRAEARKAASLVGFPWSPKDFADAVVDTVVTAVLAENVQLRAELAAAKAARNLSWRGGSLRDLLHTAVIREGGEWTVGRVKGLYAGAYSGHIYRSRIRADLGALHKAGVLVLHDTKHGRFYTAATPTAVAK